MSIDTKSRTERRILRSLKAAATRGCDPRNSLDTYAPIYRAKLSDSARHYDTKRRARAERQDNRPAGWDDPKSEWFEVYND